MPLPTKNDVHVSRALTNISVAYLQNAKDFVSNIVFPSVPVDHRSDQYHVYGSADFRRNNVKQRAPGTESAGGGFSLSQDSYTCNTYAIHQDIPDDIVNNADAAVQLEKASAIWVAQQLMIQKEVQWMTDFFATSIWGTDVTGATDFTQWDDGSSDPEADIDTGKATIKQNRGLDANTLVVSYKTHQALKRHPIVADRFKHTSSDSITTQLLARFFEVERYIVAGASYTTSEENASSETNAFIAGNHALLCYVAPVPGLMTDSAGYTFAYRSMAGANGGFRTKSFYMDKLESTRIEGQFAYDHKVVDSGAGYFFASAISG